MKLTLLGREVREDAVQRAAVCQVVERSGAVRYEQHLVASACEKVSATRTEQIKNQEQQEQKNKTTTAVRRFSKGPSPSIDSSLAGVA